jgi:structural maintenance of chromosome 2
MYLKEIILDGFKSYANRTVLTGLDPYFNSISGPNGSGKSAILDAVCFVLGMSHLPSLRVSGLQELIYKNGQAGIQRASVTLVFDNTDSSASPVGYEACPELTVTRQVVLGGRSKYLVNGHVAQPAKVQNLFHSVQLNVNNPHFLIMQGRITKVIHMKPQELLSMLEEAAGTSMYEVKKTAALKTIEKKQRKVDEINNLLAEEITPSLEKLRDERERFLHWSANNAEMERLRRIVALRAYAQAKESAQKLEKEDAVLNEQLRRCEEAQAQANEALKKLRSQNGGMKRDQRERDAKQLQQLESQAASLDKEIVKERARLEHCRETMLTEQSQQQELRLTRERLTKTLNDLKTRYSELAPQLEQRQQQAKQASEKWRTLSEASAFRSHTELIASAKQQVTLAQTEEENSKLALEAAKRELEKNSKRAAAARALEAELSKAEKAVSSVKLQLHELDYDHIAAEKLRQRRQAEEQAVHALRDRLDRLSARLAMIDFTYERPEASFEASRVKGVVARLVKVQNVDFATAIEIAAGSKLFYVIVDSEQTGKLLLERGSLARRVTMIPLNRIDDKVLEPERVRRAQQAGGNLALTLIRFDDELEPAMRYVFGRTLVCDRIEQAKKLAFSEQIRCRTVTRDGDLVDPHGTMTGGARESTPSILARVAEYNEGMAGLQIRERALAKTEDELRQLEHKADEYARLSTELTMRQRNVEAIRTRMLAEPFIKSRDQVAKLESQLREHVETRQVAERRLAELGSGTDLGAQDLAEAKAFAEQQQQLLHTEEARLERLHRQMETTQGELAETEARLEQSEQTTAQLDTDIKSLQRRLEEELEPAHRLAQEQLQQCRESLLAQAKEQALLMERIGSLESTIDSLSLEMKRLQLRLTDLAETLQNERREVARLEEEHPSLSLSAGEASIVDSEEIGRARQQLARLTAENQSLGKRINRRALSLFEKSEQEYQDLMNKKRIIENDKQKIYAAIRGLDEKKRLALEATWHRVNHDLSAIFSTLLPGADARLERLAGSQSMLDGLELRVAMGNTWKDSLAELSGGQRSLVALSLVLAMLKFKPAPMYILDEIDAALDLSHTQNVGQVIRQSFRDSQFIVVSLKPALFEHANVVFRTKLVQGASTVTRTALSRTDQATASSIQGHDPGKSTRLGHRKVTAANGEAAAEDDMAVSAQVRPPHVALAG